MKLILDVLISITLLIVLSPVLLTLALLIYLLEGGQIFFRHPRLGKDHKEFKIIKFRSMNNRTDKSGVLLPDIERTTKFGSFLRKTSLDELPGLLNVVRGDMSLVGPRPLPPQYKERYSTQQDKRHLVKPGITGWAQINGRNAISWEEKFSLDVWYVENRTLFLDFKILLLTIGYVFSKKGIVPADKDSMEEFMGSDN
tara:strand:- start:6181 stop:6774 length:594 start_codon:yes stop_codon:yes gene_type:complete